MRKLPAIMITGILLLALVLAIMPSDTLGWAINNFRQNTGEIATQIAPTATSTPEPTPTPTIIAAPPENGPNPTEVVPQAQAEAGIPTIAPTQQLLLEDLPDYGDPLDMMKYREALEKASNVNETSVLVTGTRGACFVGESKDRLVGYSFTPPSAITIPLNWVGINTPDKVEWSFGSEVHTSTTVCGAAMYGVRMSDVINTSTLAETGIWEPTGAAGMRKGSSGNDEMFEIFEQAADFNSQPTICLIGIHVNGQIINETHYQPGALYRMFFPYDMGAQFAKDFEIAWQQFQLPTEAKKGAEIARDSLVTGKAHDAMCGFLDIVDGGASRLRTCTFTPRIPDTITYCGNLNDVALPTTTP